MKIVKQGDHVRHWANYRHGWVMEAQDDNKTAGVYWAETGSTSWTGWENLRESTEREFALAMAESVLFDPAPAVP